MPEQSVKRIANKIDYQNCNREPASPLRVSREPNRAQSARGADQCHQHNRCAAPNLLKLDSRLWFQSADRFQKTSGKRQREYCDQTNKSSGSEEENEQNRSETSFASVCHA